MKIDILCYVKKMRIEKFLENFKMFWEGEGLNVKRINVKIIFDFILIILFIEKL